MTRVLKGPCRIGEVHSSLKLLGVVVGLRRRVMAKKSWKNRGLYERERGAVEGMSLKVSDRESLWRGSTLT